MLKAVLALIVIATGITISIKLWRSARAAAAVCPGCGRMVPLSETRPNVRCRYCHQQLKENNELSPGVEVRTVTPGRPSGGPPER